MRQKVREHSLGGEAVHGSLELLSDHGSQEDVDGVVERVPDLDLGSVDALLHVTRGLRGGAAVPRHLHGEKTSSLVVGTAGCDDVKTRHFTGKRHALQTKTRGALERRHYYNHDS